MSVGKTGQVSLAFGDPKPVVSQYRACTRCWRWHHVSTTCLLCAPLHETRSTR